MTFDSDIQILIRASHINVMYIQYVQNWLSGRNGFTTSGTYTLTVDTGDS